MTQFQLNQTITTREPVITVDAGLLPGRYRFQLVVVDNNSLASRPDTQVVVIVNRSR